MVSEQCRLYPPLQHTTHVCSKKNNSGDDYSTRPGGPPKGDTGTGLSKTAQKILNAQKQPAGPTLFFGNLSFQTTEQSIRQLLDAHWTTISKRKAKTAGDPPPSDEDQDHEQERKEQNPSVRKVRMGTFEDTGVCKGCVEFLLC
jgi:hypothetical protein